MPTTQVTLLLQQLKRQYPTAFKGNYLFYSQIKIRGIWDKAKLFIPWALAAMIFVPISLMLGDFVQQSFVQISEFQAQSYAMLAILLFLMLSLTLILYQIQHSSYSLYQLLRHTPNQDGYCDSDASLKSGLYTKQFADVELILLWRELWFCALLSRKFIQGK